MLTWRKKRALVVLGCMLLAVALAACGVSSSEAEVEATAEARLAEIEATVEATLNKDPVAGSTTVVKAQVIAKATAAPTQVSPSPTAGDTPIATTIVMPDFELPDTSGSTVSLSKTLSHSHFAVLVFYRGHF